METKICYTCKQEKSVGEFSKDKSKKDGLENKCKQCGKQKNKIYRQENPEKVLKRHKKYRQKNPEKIKEINKRYINKRLKSDPKFKLNKNFSNSIRNSLKAAGSSKKGRSWENLVGYNSQQLKEHLEKQFKPEMNWENHGTYWHIDHKRPKSWFSYDSAEHPEFKKCWALENLQPLEAGNNIRKSNRYEG